MTLGTTQLLAKTKENRLDRVRRALTHSDFNELANMETAGLSAVEHMDQLFQSTIDSLGGDDGYAIVDVPEQEDLYNFDVTDEDFKLEYTIEEDE